MMSGTCVNGTDYPAWMASDRDFIRLYLYKNDPERCCKHWFGEYAIEGCANSIIQGTYIDYNTTQTNKTEEYLTMWYPAITRQKCLKDGKTPTWMLAEGYVEWYLFKSKQQCCAAFGFC